MNLADLIKYFPFRFESLQSDRTYLLPRLLPSIQPRKPREVWYINRFTVINTQADAKKSEDAKAQLVSEHQKTKAELQKAQAEVKKFESATQKSEASHAKELEAAKAELASTKEKMAVDLQKA